MNKNRLLEVCTGHLQSVMAAVEGGAERIELCSALSLDGLTPSIGLLKYVREHFPQLRIHVLIRSREGDFVYSKEDLETMLTDIREAVPYADGIVCGALTKDGDIDTEALRLIVEASQGKPFTFHRAFDSGGSYQTASKPLNRLSRLVVVAYSPLDSNPQQNRVFLYYVNSTNKLQVD